MRILLIGSEYFKPWLEKLGVEVVRAGPEPEAEIRVDPGRIEAATLVAGLEPRPDLLLLTDDLGRRTLPWGLGRLDLPKAYYAVDSPLNLFWQRHLAGLFDLVAADQKDSAQEFSRAAGREAVWLPVGVDPSLYTPGSEQGPGSAGDKPDFGFVGGLDPGSRPKRAALINLLRQRYSVQVRGGRGQAWVGTEESARIYRRARLALNENLFPGVTTRMLEVMASGGCLFTEDNGNGLDELFTPGVHYIPFGPPGEKNGLFDQVERYLGDEPTRRRIARAGREECLERHSIEVRATQLLVHLEKLLERTARVGPDPLAEGWAFLLAGLRWPGRDGPRRIKRAGSLFREALRHNPGSAQAAYGLGQTRSALGDRTGAAEEFQTAVRNDPREFRYWLALGLTRAELGRVEEASADLGNALKLLESGLVETRDLSPGSLIPGQAEFHLLWGRLLSAIGEGLTPGANRAGWPMALWTGLEHLGRAVSLAPDDPEALIRLAALLDDHGQAAHSHPLWQRVADLAPERPEIGLGLARSARLGYYSAD